MEGARRSEQNRLPLAAVKAMQGQNRPAFNNRQNTRMRKGCFCQNDSRSSR